MWRVLCVSGSFVHVVIVIVMPWSPFPYLWEQVGSTRCPNILIPSKSRCALEDNVMPSIDIKGSAASDRETERGKPISKGSWHQCQGHYFRAKGPGHVIGQCNPSCQESQALAPPLYPQPPARQIGLPGPKCRLP